jgi:hypothetical protein
MRRYSDQLAAAAQHASALRLIVENELVANWGGQYSTFNTQMPADPSIHPARARLAQEMVNADAVELELALQLRFLKVSESMGNHDSEIVGACGVD